MSTELPDLTDADGIRMYADLACDCSAPYDSCEHMPEPACPLCSGNPFTHTCKGPSMTDSADEFTREQILNACRLIGRQFDHWMDLVVAATHSEDIITPDGGGDFEVLEERLIALGQLATRAQIDGKRWGQIHSTNKRGQLLRVIDAGAATLPIPLASEQLDAIVDAVIAALPELMGDTTKEEA